MWWELDQLWFTTAGLCAQVSETETEGDKFIKVRKKIPFPSTSLSRRNSQTLSSRTLGSTESQGLIVERILFLSLSIWITPKYVKGAGTQCFHICWINVRHVLPYSVLANSTYQGFTPSSARTNTNLNISAPCVIQNKHNPWGWSEHCVFVFFRHYSLAAWAMAREAWAGGTIHTSFRQ